MLRFVIGHSDHAAQEAEMNREIEDNGAFLRLPVKASAYHHRLGCQCQGVPSPWALLVVVGCRGKGVFSTLQEAYLSLTKKTLVFLQEVTQHYDADYIIKVDDDVFLRVDRVPTVIAQWKEGKAGLVSASSYPMFEDRAVTGHPGSINAFCGS